MRYALGLLLIFIGLLTLRHLGRVLSPDWPWEYGILALSLFVVGFILAAPPIVMRNSLVAVLALVVTSLGLMRLGAVLGNNYAESLLMNDAHAMLTEGKVLRRADIFPKYPGLSGMSNSTPCMLISYTVGPREHIGRVCVDDARDLPSSGSVLQIQYVQARPEIYSVVGPHFP